MELTNDFRVGISVPEAWKVLTDVERIAPLLPGAQLEEVDGDEYRGVVKVKVGPITAQYKGAATFVDRDQAVGKVVLSASGRDTRGQGNASATITATMQPDGDGTKVTVVTDLTVTGKVAQFGRGVLADVSAKLLRQFVGALEADLAASGREGSSESELARPATNGNGRPDPAPVSSSAATTHLPEGAEVGSSATSANGPRRIDLPEVEPVDLLAVAGGSTLKRLLPVAGVVLVVFVLVVRRRARKLSRLARIATSVLP